MAFTEDYDLFFDQDDFAVAATVNGVAVSGIFERAWVEVNIGNVPYSGEMPTLRCRSTDLSGKMGKTAVISGTSYTIIDIRPDGTGESLAILTEQ